ncbi:MAG: hypothetical protein IT304_05010 [Dehalococcoidia bacterium]|nr:hypothetical protein [Dehalococcoidia bacterium]
MLLEVVVVLLPSMALVAGTLLVHQRRYHFRGPQAVRRRARLRRHGA